MSHSNPANARTGDAARICTEAVAIVSQETGVPADVLLAITLTETGRKSGGSTRPWPWTVNMEGEGHWFETEDDARAYVYEHFKRGARSFDVGCFQLNYKWHHQGFSSIDEMFDPIAGGRYAARFLSDLYSEKGNWREAAGAYHSRTPEYAERYMEKFSAYRASADEAPAFTSNAPISTTTNVSDPISLARRKPRVNSFPLLQSGQGQGANGSLVPLTRSENNPSLVDFNGTR